MDKKRAVIVSIVMAAIAALGLGLTYRGKLVSKLHLGDSEEAIT